jgi:dynein heavy chain
MSSSCLVFDGRHGWVTGLQGTDHTCDVHLQAKRVLSDTNFMRSLEEFNKDNIPDSVIHKLRKYIDDPQYQPDIVAKQSRAAMSLCMWTRAMDVYNRSAVGFELANHGTVVEQDGIVGKQLAMYIKAQLLCLLPGRQCGQTKFQL